MTNQTQPKLTPEQAQELNDQIQFLVKKIETMEEEFMKDFSYNLVWKSENLYKYKKKKELLIMFLNRTSIQEATEYLTEQIVRWYPSKSTCLITNATKEWELEVYKEIISDFKFIA
jgi:hypothetical protein